MTDDIKSQIGYKLMLAFEGTEPPAHIRKWLAERQTGGFTLFRHLNVASPEQVRALTAELQGNFTQAKADYQQALNLAPEYTEAQQGLNRLAGKQ